MKILQRTIPAIAKKLYLGIFHQQVCSKEIIFRTFILFKNNYTSEPDLGRVYFLRNNSVFFLIFFEKRLANENCRKCKQIVDLIRIYKRRALYVRTATWKHIYEEAR